MAHVERASFLSEVARLIGSGFDETVAAAATHPDPWVRQSLLRHLLAMDDRADRQQINELLLWLIHDPDDFIAFQAIDAVGNRRVREALHHLLLIVGSASERFTVRAGKPVGIGHSLVLDAIERIVGTRSSVELGALEREIFPEGRQEFDVPRADHPAPKSGSVLREAPNGTIFIPSGDVTVGAPEAALPDRVFDWSDVSTADTFVVGPFFIDEFCVTACEYDDFANSRSATSHEFCHEQEPPDKSHARNTLYDDRFRTDDPVTGVDWFDAFAYSRSRGRRLPTEWEWQRAAQGDDARAYPWGDEFDVASAQCYERLTGAHLPSVEEWREGLLQLAQIARPPMVAANVRLNVSPFGVVNMAANCWEWTGTSFYSRGPMDPVVGRRDAVELIYDWRSYASIRGGTWSSHRELVSVAFRGKDLLTDRHNEIGFRTAADAS